MGASMDFFFFFVKDTKNGGDHCKKLQKWTRGAVIFVIGIEKIEYSTFQGLDLS